MAIRLWKVVYGEDFIRKLMDGNIVLSNLAEDGFGDNNKTFNASVFIALVQVAREMGYASYEEEAKKAVEEASMILFGVPWQWHEFALP